MKFINKLTGWIIASGLLLAAGAANAEHSVGNVVPGIVDPSIPYFENAVNVRANRGNWTITGNRDFTFTDSNQTWFGTTSRYVLEANFDNAGNFVDGTVSLVGKIPDLGITSRETLVTADLISFGWDGFNTIGFNTDNIVCSSMLGVDCTLKESVIISLDNGFLGDVNARFRTSGTAVTSVPLPAAAWLFVAGLGLLGAKARKRRSAC